MADVGWRTINGAHVYIGSKGTITKGNKSVIGKKPSELNHPTVKGKYIGKTKSSPAKKGTTHKTTTSTPKKSTTKQTTVSQMGKAHLAREEKRTVPNKPPRTSTRRSTTSTKSTTKQTTVSQMGKQYAEPKRTTQGGKPRTSTKRSTSTSSTKQTSVSQLGRTHMANANTKRTTAKPSNRTTARTSKKVSTSTTSRTPKKATTKKGGAVKSTTKVGNAKVNSASIKKYGGKAPTVVYNKDGSVRQAVYTSKRNTKVAQKASANKTTTKKTTSASAIGNEYYRRSGLRQIPESRRASRSPMSKENKAKLQKEFQAKMNNINK